MKNNIEKSLLLCLALMGWGMVGNAQIRETGWPASQVEYWTLIFHADSLMVDQQTDAAEQCYDRAFSVEKYILPSSLLTAARKMEKAGKKEAALKYIGLRVRMEPDFYLKDESAYPEMADTFRLRANRYGYDVELKERLEQIFEHDQYDRELWRLACTENRGDSLRIELLARQAINTDQANLTAVNGLLQRQGFPQKKRVGEFAVQAVWIVFQHSDLDNQKAFLPLMRKAVASGDIDPAYLAVLEDRINVRDGKPQRYGSQYGPDGKLCPLLDSSRVDEWRKEVGLPALKH